MPRGPLLGEQAGGARGWQLGRAPWPPLPLAWLPGSAPSPSPRAGRVSTCRHSSAPSASQSRPRPGRAGAGKALAFLSLAPHESLGEGGRLHPTARDCSERAVTHRAGRPGRQARQSPVLPQDPRPPRATPREGISTLQPWEASGALPAVTPPFTCPPYTLRELIPVAATFSRPLHTGFLVERCPESPPMGGWAQGRASSLLCPARPLHECGLSVDA